MEKRIIMGDKKMIPFQAWRSNLIIGLLCMILFELTENMLFFLGSTWFFAFVVLHWIMYLFNVITEEWKNWRKEN